MTHNFKTGVTYKTRGGERAYYCGVSFYGDPLFLVQRSNGKFEGVVWADIIGLWEESPEEIDVANMWVHVRYCGAQYAAEIWPEDGKPAEYTIAIIRVSEWEAIKRGDRKLIKGEGLYESRCR